MTSTAVESAARWSIGGTSATSFTTRSRVTHQTPALLGLDFVEPMLPTLVRGAPKGDEWLHEIKHDGCRTQLVIVGEEMRAFTRNGHDWTDRYRPVLRAAGELNCSSAIIDGEMIVQDAEGRSDFAAFKSAMLRHPDWLIFRRFDLLHLNGADLRPEPLVDRREQLRELVECHDPGCWVQYSEHFIGGDGALCGTGDRMGLRASSQSVCAVGIGAAGLATG